MSVELPDNLDDTLNSRFVTGPQRWIANYLMRDVARGVTSGVESTATLFGQHDFATRTQDTMNEVTGTNNARWDTNPGSFLLQRAGEALPTLPLSAVRLGARVVAPLAARLPEAVNTLGRMGLRAAEALTPMTFPFSGRNYLLNAGVGSVVSAGAEEVSDRVNASAAAVRGAQRPVASIELPDDGTPQPTLQSPAPTRAVATAGGAMAPSVARAQAQPVSIELPDEPSAGGGAVDQQLSAPGGIDVSQLPDTLTTGEKILSWTPVAIAGGAVGLGVRQAVRRNAATAAIRGTAVNPGAEVNPNADMPGFVQSATSAIADDQQAIRGKINAAESAGAITPERADFLRSMADKGLNRTARQGAVTEFYRSGRLPDGTQIGKATLTQQSDDFARLEASNPQLAARMQEAWTLADEAANRERAIHEGKVTSYDHTPATTPGTPSTPQMVARQYLDPNTGGWAPRAGVAPIPEPARVGLHDISYPELHRRLAAHRADPEVRAFLEDAKAENAQWRQALDKHGVFESAELRKMGAVNPYYRPTLYFDDPGARHLTRREIAENAAPKKGQDVFQAKQEYAQEVIHFIEQNNARRELANFLRDEQRRLGPNAKQFVGKTTKVGDVDKLAPGRVTYRENGQRLSMEVHNPAIETAFRNDPKVVAPLLNATRKTFQYFTTGPGFAAASSVGGVPGLGFAPYSGAYNLASASITRKFGTYAGWGDKLVQQATKAVGLPEKLQFGWRADPTFAIQSIGGAIADVSAMAAREISAVTRHKPGLRNFSDKLHEIYTNSEYSQMGRLSAVNSGGAYGGDYATKLGSDVGGVSPRRDAARPVVRNVGPQSWSDIEGRAQQFGYTYVPWEMRKGWQLYKEVLDIVANSPQSAYWRQNPQARATEEGKHALARRTRQLGADPSISGSSARMQALASSVPWLNVYVQSFNTYAKAFRENWQGTTAAIAIGTTQIAVLGAYSATLYDEWKKSRGEEPEAVRHRTLSSSDDMAGRTRIYIPGYSVYEAPLVPIEPMVGPIQAGMNWLADRLFGLDRPEWHSPAMAENRHALEQMIHNSHTNSLWTALNRGYLQFAPPPTVALAGKLAGTDLSEAFRLYDPRVQDMTRRSSRGYQEGEVPRDPMPQSLKDVLTTLGGAAGTLAERLGRTVVSAYRDTGDAYGTVGAFSATANLAGEDRSLAPTLWAGPRRETGYDTNAEQYNKVSTKLNDLQDWMTNLARPHTIGTGSSVQHSTEFGGGRPQVNPESAQVLQSLHQLTVENRQFIDARNTLKDKINDMRGNGYRLLDPRSLRAAENEINDQIRDINEKLMQRVYERERMLSEHYTRVRGRPVTVSLLDFDPSRGLDQFE